MPKIDDLTILLKVTDKTKGPIDNVTKRMNKLGSVGVIAGRAIGGAFALVASTFALAAENGKQVSAELGLMSEALGTSLREADALFEVVRQASPTAEIDKVKEAVLTLKEGFFDARAESGPLFDLVKDFGANVDFSLEDPRQQLLEFLKVLRMMESNTVRVGAVISNLGADDAKPFLALANDVGKLDDAINQLSGSIDDIPNVLTQSQQDNILRARDSAAELSAIWDNFSLNVYARIAPALTRVNEILTKIIGATDSALDSIEKYSSKFGLLSKLILGPAAPLYNSISEYLFGSDEPQTVPILPVVPGASNDTPSTPTGPTSEQIKAQEKLQKQIDKTRMKFLEIRDIDILGVNSVAGIQKARADLAAFDLDVAKFVNKMGFSNELEDKLLREFDVEINAALEQIAAREIPVVANANLVLDMQALSAGTQGMRDGVREQINDNMEAVKSFDAMGRAISGVSSILGTLGSSFAKTKAQARTFVAIQQTLAVVSAYSAATQALADITSPTPFQKFAAYSAVLAQGLAGVAAIKQAGQSLGAGGSVPSEAGAGSGGAQGPIGSTVEPEQRRNNGTLNLTIENGGDDDFLLNSSQIRKVFDEIVRNGYFDEINISAA